MLLRISDISNKVSRLFKHATIKQGNSVDTSELVIVCDAVSVLCKDSKYTTIEYRIDGITYFNSLLRSDYLAISIL